MAPTSGASEASGYPKQTLQPACQGNAACATDFDCIDGTPYYIFTQAGPTADPVNTLQSVCVRGAPTADTSVIPDDVITEARADWAITHLEGASAVTRPVEAPIGLPALFTAQGATVVDRTLVLAGVPLHLRATLTYTWDFGDHTTLTTSNPGRPYDRDRPPSDARFADDYVQHTYDTPGPVLVMLTTAWTHVVLTRTDSGTSVALPGRVSDQRLLALDVVELRSMLTTP